MSENNKFISGFAVGALAGTALVLFLQSSKGQEFIATLKEEAAGLQDEVMNAASDAEDSIDALLAKAKKLVSDLEQKINKTPTV